MARIDDIGGGSYSPSGGIVATERETCMNSFEAQPTPLPEFRMLNYSGRML